MGPLVTVDPGCHDGLQGLGRGIADPLVNDNRGCSVKNNGRAETMSVASQGM